MPKVDEVFAFIALPFAIAGFALSTLTATTLGPKTKRLEEQGAAIVGCVSNPAYAGITVDDQRQLFLQCIADYKDSH